MGGTLVSALHDTAHWGAGSLTHPATSARRRRTARVAVWGVSALAHAAALILIVNRFGATRDTDTPPAVPPITIEVVTPAMPAAAAAPAPTPERQRQPAAPHEPLQPRIQKRVPPTPRPSVAKPEQAPAIANAKATPTPDIASTQQAPGPSAQPSAAGTASPSPAPAPEPVVTPPIGSAAYLRNPPPHYPQAAQEEGWEGRVVVRVHVDANGRPVEVELHTSSGHDLLDKAALAAVRHWTFVPAKRGTVAVDGWVDVPLDFRLN